MRHVAVTIGWFNVGAASCSILLWQDVGTALSDSVLGGHLPGTASSAKRCQNRRR
jgi:hypothetical protein